MSAESSSTSSSTPSLELASNGLDNGHQNGHDDAEIASPDELSTSEIASDELVVTGNGHAGWTPGFRAKTSPDKALTFPRRNTRAGEDVWETSGWERRTAAITGETGKSVFEQKDCEIPSGWSQLATNVVVSKYFRGPLGTPQRETSVKQVIGRVADTLGEWGQKGGYFASDADGKSFRDELAFYLLHQYGAFNSPVWFNLGVKNSKAQCSACFINSVHDDMESIMELAATEARLFKGGSGAGSNLWRIRSSKEQLSGGGAASGPVSFMRGWDAFAGAIKCLTPDAMVFTQGGLQRLDEVIDTDLEPGFHADDSLILATKDGPTRISHVYVSPEAPTLRAELSHTGLRLTGTHSHPVMTLSPEFRLEWKALCDLEIGDRVAVSRRTEMWPEAAPSFDFAPQLTYAKKNFSYPTQMTPELARLLGYMTSEGCMDAERFRFCNADEEVFADFLRCVEAVFGVEPTRNVSARTHPQTGVTTQLFEACWPNAVRFLESVGLSSELSAHKRVPRSIRQSPRALVVEFLRAYFEGDGHVSTHIYAASASRGLLEEVQLLLLNMGLLPLLRSHPVNGKAYWSLYLRGEAAFGFAREIGFISERKIAAAERLGDKNLNTNIDTVPFLVDVLRTRTQGNALFQCADGSRRALGFGFFNRKAGSEISYSRLKNTPNLRAQLALVEPQWAQTLDAVLDGEWFWDSVQSVEAAPDAVTYDFTVPQTHSFVANGIVNHNSGGTCLAPYQRVYTEQGPVAVEELARREEFIALSFDPPANRFKAKRARAWLAGQKRVVRVSTDKGSFDLSFDHPVKLSSGEYVRAGDLQPGFSLFACSIDAQHGHARVHLRDGQKGKEFWHRLIAADVMGADLTNRVVHHCDGNKENNALENLQVMTQADHAALHGRELAMSGEHPFQMASYSHAGEANGMHRDSQFWQSSAADDYRATQGQLLTQSGRATEMQREAARQKTLNTAFRILNAGWPIDTFERYAQGRKIVVGRIASIAQLREQIESEFGSHDEFVAEVARQNHRVMSVETIGEMDVYDVEVQCPTPDDKSPQTGHNFLIWDGDERIGSGVIVANTRRAAKMVILNADHPDIEEFITCKSTEEKKAWALIEAGYNGGWNVPGGAYDSVMFQNANHSVRVGDDFMRAAENNAPWNTRAVRDGKVVETKNAREMLLKIAECTHLCGDPGLQYDSTINDWHTCANTDRIYASNPCCVTGDTLVGVADGRNAVAISDLVGSEVPVYAHDHATGKTTISRMWNIGVKREGAPVFRVTLDDGSSFRATDDHLIMLRDGSYRMVRDLKPNDALMPFHSKVLAPEKSRTKRRHAWTGQSWTPQFRAIWNYSNGAQPAGTHLHHADFNALNDAIENLVLMSAGEHNALHVGKMLGDQNPARRLMNDEWRENISRAVSGENNPNFGRTHSPETRAKMSERAAARWQNEAQHEKASQAAKTWISDAKSEGRQVGRTRGETFERSCPVCRAAFQTQRIEQIFCGSKCRYSPMGYAMSGEKGGQSRAGTPQSAEIARRAALVGNQHAILRAARALMDSGVTPSLENWAELRPQLAELGFARIPLAATVARTFADSAQLQEAAAHFNHKVVSVEFCGHEDVYDGTVDTHHNFAILTSSEKSCADGHQNFSGIFIHNSEFVFLDDTACNLSSLNLLKFYDFETGYFDAASYTHACETFLTAQEIIVSFASYPTAKIAENSELYRPLGLGYCNIGALLMAMGLAYDSDQGRAFAGALTAIMTGAAYRQSAKIARNTGPFEGYARNREPMLRVIAKHRDAVNGIDQTLVAENVMQEARTVWDDALVQGQKYGYRNAQVSVLAPTGTISFMMDADTTGIEPDIALVKYKKLVGGGLLKIVNQTVPAALRKLAYNEDEIKSIVDYIDKNDTIEGAPGLRDEHLSVFDCAFKAMNGTRSIHHLGHIKMMAAAQPFLSGAISKCVTGDTMIASTEGLFPIGSLYRGEKPGEFGEVSMTLASIGAPQAADLFYYGGLRPTKKVVLGDGRSIEGTGNHRVKVANSRGYGWKLLEEIESGDFVSVRLGAEMWAKNDAELLVNFNPPALHSAQKRIDLPAKMTPQLARFLGQYIAEGNKTASNTMVRVTNNNSDVLKNCLAAARDLFGIEGRIETDKRNGVTSFVVASKTLCEWLDHIGAGGNSATKQIPWSILRSTRECVAEFVGGLWLDGYVRGDGMTAICLNSPELLKQLQVVLNNFGLRAHIIQKYNKPYDKFFGELGMHGADARRFAKLFRLDDAHKTAALEALCAKEKRVSSVHSDVIPAFKTEIQGFIKVRRDTQKFRQVFDARTRFLSWQTVKSVADFYGESLFEAIPDLREILENNIHFVAVREVTDEYSAVFDFQVPSNHAFLGNGIINHNTVNMPQDCTVEDIFDGYMQSWKLGVKAVAIYRDNSKRTQPLSTASDAQKAEKKEVEIKRANRRKLPDERQSITHKFSIAGQEGYFMVGLYEDGSPGELFIKMSKEGSTISGLMDSFAVSISMCLQYGVPLRVLVNKFSHTRFEPSGYTTNREIPIAKSLMDYIFRWFDLKFHPNGDNGHFGKAAPVEEVDAKKASEPELALSDTHPKAPIQAKTPSIAPALTLFPSYENGASNGNLADAQASLMQSQSDAPPCPNCGAITVRSGSCYKCNECGTTTGCG